MSCIRVVLVDDHRVVTRGIRSYLESFPDLQVIGSTASGEELLAQIEDWLPDVVILDLLMPGGMDGVETTRRLRQLTPRTRIVALTASTDEARLMGVLRAGAIGYVRKDSDPELLLATVRAAARGQSMIDPACASSALLELARGHEPGGELTERETEVLRRLAHGLTNREIAEALFIGEETVKTHVGAILSKLHLAHRTQAALYALKHGLVSIDELNLH
jgi:two-component system, NarL family, response regulator LiaR